MSLSIISFIVSFIVAQRLRKYCKTHALPKLNRIYSIVVYVALTLFLADMTLKLGNYSKWIWHIGLIALLLFSLQQKELRALRMTIYAFAPFVIISLITDLALAINGDYFQKWQNIFDYAEGFSFIWMVVIFFTHSRQLKQAEKERIKRQKEDEVNRAIAIRKVELEDLVAERTAELTKQKEELEQTLSELRITQKQLIQSEKMASLGELTAGIAHEIQNPLNFVNNFSEVSRELIDELKSQKSKLKSEEQDEILNDIDSNLEKINHHGKRADAIVKGMLQHSRSSSGKRELTDVNALCDEYLRLSYHGLRAKDKTFNAKFETDFDEDVGTINIVPQDIGRVILNLINNAFYAVTEKKNASANLSADKAGSAGQSYEPTVTVITRKLKNAVEIRVKDNGSGIPKSVKEKIFQPFFTTKPAGQGTGLGLSLSYDIITKGHGGEIKVESEEGIGTEFIVVIPIV